MASISGGPAVEWHQRPSNPKNPIVFFDKIHTGRMKMELFADIVPKTSENFRKICPSPNSAPSFTSSILQHLLEQQHHGMEPDLPSDYDLLTNRSWWSIGIFCGDSSFSLKPIKAKVSDRVEATQKALLRAFKLFLLGVFLQGGYFHGVTSLTYGVDVEKIRLFGILQRIAIGYVVAALCEIWLPCQRWRGNRFYRNYTWQWCVVLLLFVMYLGFLYGLYVPDWQYVVPSDSSIMTNNSIVYTVKCCVRGDLSPACNSAGMIDRYILGVDHLYAKPVYRNLKECNISSHGQVPGTSPSWCHTPFDPEGILSSLTAAVTCIIGLQYGHILIQLQDHKERLWNWSIFSVLLMSLGLLLCFLGIPLNKSLYTVSYLMVTTSSAGITFCILYILVDVYDWRCLTCVLEWMGKHSLTIFILVTSNIVVIMAQGFYLKAPQNNIVHWIITRFVHK